MKRIGMTERTWKRLTDNDERTWANTLDQLAEAQLTKFLERLPKVGWREAVNQINEIIKPEQYTQIYAALVPAQGLKYFRYTNQRAKQFVKELLTKDIDPDDQYFLYMREYLDQLTANNVISVTETARKESIAAIRSAVESALEEGAGEIELMRLIEQQVALEWRIRSVFRSQRIARTEVAALANRSSLLGVEQTGLTYKKRWETFLDNRTRASHIAVHGTELERHEYFQVGDARLRYPLDSTPIAKEVINCRCRLSYILD